MRRKVIFCKLTLYETVTAVFLAQHDSMVITAHCLQVRNTVTIFVNYTHTITLAVSV